MQRLIEQLMVTLELDVVGQKYLRFNTYDYKSFSYRVRGEVPETWVYAITGMDNLIAQLVEAVEEREIDSGPVLAEPLLLGVRLTTTKGYVDIEFRNNEGEAYGGWLEAVDSIPEGTVMRPLQQDYLAGDVVDPYLGTAVRLDLDMANHTNKVTHLALSLGRWGVEEEELRVEENVGVGVLREIAAKMEAADFLGGQYQQLQAYLAEDAGADADQLLL